jgi:hypothetical protein
VRRAFLQQVLQVTALAVPARQVFLPRVLRVTAHGAFLLPGHQAMVLRVDQGLMSMAVRIVLELGGKNTTLVVQQPMAPAPIPLGTSTAYLPAGCVSITFSSTQYYQCGPN